MHREKALVKLDLSAAICNERFKLIAGVLVIKLALKFEEVPQAVEHWRVDEHIRRTRIAGVVPIFDELNACQSAAK